MILQELKQTITKDIPIPLYYQLKEQLLRRIENGALQVGDLIPSEAEFCETLQISRPTVRQALNELVTEGHLDRQKGRGTFVTRPKVDGRFFQKLESFDKEMTQKGLTPSTEVLQFQTLQGSEPVCRKLGLSIGSKVLYLQRLRFTDGEPLVFLDTYLPYELFPALLEEDFARHSLYAVLESRYGACVTRVSREMEAVNVTAAEAKMLQISKNQAVCLVRTVAYTREGVPVEYSVARYRGDRNRFSVELYRESEEEQR